MSAVDSLMVYFAVNSNLTRNLLTYITAANFGASAMFMGSSVVK